MKISSDDHHCIILPVIVITIVGSGRVIVSAGVLMGSQFQVNKVLLVGFVLLVALAIPIFFILNRLLEFRETETRLSQLSSQRTSTTALVDTLALTATETPTRTETPTLTSTPTLTHTPTISVTSTPIGPFHNAVVEKVVHLTENGQQTMIKITVAASIDGDYRADVETQWNSREYWCFILGEDNDQLFCLGQRLPATTNAVIMVYEVLGAGEESLVLESNFEVPAMNPTKVPTT